MKTLGALLLFVLSQGVTADDGNHANRVSFSVTATEQVSTDTLVVRLFAQHEAKSQRKAADEVNTVMSWALAKASSAADVKAQTLDYRTNPQYDQRKIRAWQVRQTLRLQSTNPGALTELLSDLQERLGVESMQYTISKNLRDVVERRLVQQAIADFTAQAKLIASSFNFDSYRLIDSQIGAQGASVPRPMAFQARAMSVQNEMAAPAIESGEQDVTVRVSGTIELLDQ